MHGVAASRIGHIAPEIGLAVDAVHEGVAAEQALTVIEVVVDLELNPVLRLGVGPLLHPVVLIRERQARDLRRRIVGHRFERNGADQIAGNDVAGEWIAQKLPGTRRVGPRRKRVEDGAHLAVGGVRLREIAASFQIGRHGVLRGAGA